MSVAVSFGVEFPRTFALPFGSTNIEPNAVFIFSAPVSDHAKFAIQRAGNAPVDQALGGLAIPHRFNPTNRYPILIVSATSDGSASSIAAMGGYTNAALKLGWVVLAAEGPYGKPANDNVPWRWAMLSSALAQIHAEWPGSRAWPVACAGFSGGAKWSPYLAATLMRQGYRVIGLFMGGCNEDAASVALTYYQPGAKFKEVPIFLSTGTLDSIAPPVRAAFVKQSMDRYGFKQIRFESYVGDHRVNHVHVESALRWFQELHQKPDATAPPIQTDKTGKEPIMTEDKEKKNPSPPQAAANPPQ